MPGVGEILASLRSAQDHNVFADASVARAICLDYSCACRDATAATAEWLALLVSS